MLCQPPTFFQYCARGTWGVAWNPPLRTPCSKQKLASPCGTGLAQLFSSTLLLYYTSIKTAHSVGVMEHRMEVATRDIPCVWRPSEEFICEVRVPEIWEIFICLEKNHFEGHKTRHFFILEAASAYVYRDRMPRPLDFFLAMNSLFSFLNRNDILFISLFSIFYLYELPPSSLL